MHCEVTVTVKLICIPSHSAGSLCDESILNLLSWQISGIRHRIIFTTLITL